MKINARHKRFADEYLIDLNATRAYKEAYPSCKKDETARTNGSRLLADANVSAYIKQRMRDRERRTEITQDMVLQELAKIGFADVTDFVTIEGSGPGAFVSVKATSDMQSDKIGAMAGIKEGANGVEIKLNDKGKALELIGRHLGMFKDKVEVSGLNDEKSKLDDLIKQMRGGDG